MAPENSKVTYGMLKGKVAEAIIFQLFSDAGYSVVRFGYEHTLPELAAKRKGLNGKIANQLRSIPDLVIYDPDKTVPSPYMIEVKYRAKISEIELRDKILLDYPFDDAFILFVTPTEILIQTAGHLKVEQSFQSLKNHNLFPKIKANLVDEYQSLIKDIFSCFPKNNNDDYQNDD